MTFFSNAASRIFFIIYIYVCMSGVFSVRYICVMQISRINVALSSKPCKIIMGEDNKGGFKINIVQVTLKMQAAN
jgi:hypothetical protein